MGKLYGIRVTYGDVTFEEANIQSFSRVIKRNGPDYLYTEATLTIRALYTPGTQAEPFQKTDIKVLGLLPRKRLTIHVGHNDTPWLDIGPENDVAHGPFVLSTDIVKVVAGKSAWVDVTFQVNFRGDESPTPAGPPKSSVVLSNRWTAANAQDAREWNIRTIRGRAHFDGRQLTKKPGPPWNTLYKALLLPVPLGYKRVAVNAQVSEDGLVLEYTIVDQQVPYVTIPPFISDCSVRVNIGMGGQRTASDYIVEAMQSATQAAKDLVGLGLQVAVFNPSTTAASASAATAAAPVAGIGVEAMALVNLIPKLFMGNIPTIDFQIIVTAQGHAWSNMRDVQAFAHRVALQRYNVGTAGADSDSMRFDGIQMQADVRNRVCVHVILFSRDNVLTMTKKNLKRLASVNLVGGAALGAVAGVAVPIAGAVIVGAVVGGLAGFATDNVVMESNVSPVNTIEAYARGLLESHDHETFAGGLARSESGVVSKAASFLGADIGPRRPSAWTFDALRFGGSIETLILAALSGGFNQPASTLSLGE